MRQRGILTKWDDGKGFGFITPSTGESPVFVHISAFPRGRRPAVNEKLSYTIAKDRAKRTCADKVAFERPAPGALTQTRRGSSALPFACLFIAAIAAATYVGLVGLVVAALYGGLSALSLLLYGMDKSAARSGGPRTPEATLHIIALAGGWPGAVLAQRMFRHKTIKQPFQRIFWCAVVANCAGLAWLLTSPEAMKLLPVFSMS